MKFTYKILSFTLTSLILFIVNPQLSTAQMFSIDDTEPQRTRITGLYTVVGIGWEIGSFEYTGSVADEIDRLDFNDSILRFSLESPGLDLGVSFGGQLTGMNDHTYLNINGRISNQFPVFTRERFLFFIPLQLTTDLKRVRKEVTDFEFQQSSLTLGTGFNLAAQLSKNIDFTIKGTPNYGFSFSQGNLFGGNLFQADGKAKLLIKNLIGSNALSIGYHFDYRSYNIDGDLSDYDYSSHSFVIGYAF